MSDGPITERGDPRDRISNQRESSAVTGRDPADVIREALDFSKGVTGLEQRNEALAALEDMQQRQAELIERCVYLESDAALVAAEAALADANRTRDELADRLQHFIDCADTPLMRDVLAERDAANKRAGDYADTLRDAKRAIDDFGRWAAHPNDPTYSDWALVVRECEQSSARIGAALDGQEQT
jgi:hypothetical protein